MVPAEGEECPPRSADGGFLHCTEKEEQVWSAGRWRVGA